MKRSLFQEFFPEDITISHKVSTYNEKVCKHIHENFEILFINCNNVVGTIGEKQYKVKKNTLILLSNIDLHWFRMDEPGYFDRYVITFMPENLASLSTNVTNLLDCFFYRPFPDSQFIELDTKQTEEIVTFFENLINSTKPEHRKLYGNDLSIILQFANILLWINRYYREKYGLLFIDFEDKNYRTIYTIMNYLHTHYPEEITLDTLARDFDLDKFRLSKLFHAVTGLSPIQYLIRCRFENAKQRLQAETTVDEVCFEIGFNSLSHFSKSFKKYYGISPKAYQLQHHYSSKNQSY
jgi:AraC-like DNA-binding protein